MRMSSKALLSLCRAQLGGRQARAMMSPSPANKLWLTLWGPWRKGNGMEWECAVVMLQDDIHRRWEAMVMLGEGGGKAPWNLWEGEGQMTTAAGIAAEEKEILIQMETSNTHDSSIFISNPREQQSHSALPRVNLSSFPNVKPKIDNKRNTQQRRQANAPTLRFSFSAHQ